MATVPGPQEDGPLPKPGPPAEEPMYDPFEEPDTSDPYRGDDPDWMPTPYSPEWEREHEGVGEPVQ